MLCSQEQHRDDKKKLCIAGICYTRGSSSQKTRLILTGRWSGGFSSNCTHKIWAEPAMHSQKNKAMPAQEGRLYCSGWDLLMSQLEGGRPLGARMMLGSFFLSQTCWFWHVYSNLGFFFLIIAITVTIFLNEKIESVSQWLMCFPERKNEVMDVFVLTGLFLQPLKPTTYHMSLHPHTSFWMNFAIVGGSGYFLVIKQ